MKLTPLIIGAMVLTSCGGKLNGDINSDGGLDLLLFECFGWCKLSNAASTGAVTSTKKQRRSVAIP